MRQLKTFMKNRKEDILGCGNCSCYTLQCWRNSDVNCGCGDNGGGGTALGNKVLLIGTPQTGTMKLFLANASGEDYIALVFGGGDSYLSGILDSEGGSAILEILTSNYEHESTSTIRTMPFLLGKGGIFPSDGMEGTIDRNAMSLVENVFNAPTEANKQALIDAIDNAIDALEGGDLNASFVTYSTAGSTITIIGTHSTTPVGEEKEIAAVAVSPDSETITVTSSDPAILRVRAELIPDTPLHAYNIYGEGLSTGTATVTITGVDDPTASKSFSIEILR